MDIAELAKRRGFFWQSSLIHGPIAGFYDYAHLGCALKRRWEDAWRGFFLAEDNFHEIQPSVIMPEPVFKASGHLEHFVDPVAACPKCGNQERADHLLEDVLKEKFEGLSAERLKELIRKHGIKCGKCGSAFGEVKDQNMTFRVRVGTDKDSRTAYLTPETAQGAYVNFRQMFDVLRRRLPMGLAIVGKAFRNEISPRNALLRMREFTQAELQVFLEPGQDGHPSFKGVERERLSVVPAGGKLQEMACRDIAEKLKLPRNYVYYLSRMQDFYLGVMDVPKAKFRLKQLSEEEKAFYNKHHWDIEVKLSGGWTELAGLHHRGDHDLSRHGKVSGEGMEASMEGRKFVPHVLELSFGVDRNLYALLELACAEEKERTVLRFPRALSPFDAGIFPLVKKDGLREKALEVKTLLERSGFSAFYDESGSIGRRYRRIDEIGVAAGLTVDYDSLRKGDVTLRDRDSMEQVRVGIKELPGVLARFRGGEELSVLGRPLKPRQA